MLPEGEWNPSLFPPSWAFSLVRLRTLYKVVPTFWYEIISKKKPSLLIDQKTSAFIRVVATRIRKILFNLEEPIDEIAVATTPLGAKLESIQAMSRLSLRDDLQGYLLEGSGIRVGLTDEGLYHLCWLVLALMKLSLSDRNELQRLDKLFWEGEKGLSVAFSGLLCSYLFIRYRKDPEGCKKELERICEVLNSQFQDVHLQQTAPHFFSALVSFYNLAKVFSGQLGDLQWPKLFPRRTFFILRGNTFWKALKGKLARLN